MSDFIGIDITGDKEIMTALQKLPTEVGGEVVDSLSKYIIDVYKHYPTPKRVSRAEAFPNLSITTPSGKTLQGYSSWAQFKKIMSLVSSGQVPYKRTQTLRNNWKQYGSGMKSIIANETPYSGYVMGSNTQQSRHLRMIGWMNFDKIFTERREQINRKMSAAINKALSKLGFR